MTPDVMIDIETLSTHPNDAVILSIAAVPFLLYREAPEILGCEMWVLDLHTQIAKGRDISQGTLEFWRNQSAAARSHWEQGEHLDVPEVLARLSRAISASSPPIVWAHGVCFDIGNLESLHRQFSIPIPWKYNAVRDARTVVNAFRERRSRAKDLNLVAHDPTSDCIQQIWRLWEHWPDELDPQPCSHECQMTA